ncbi:DUF3649 domain-containing protein [Lampropedia puyangensis]|uniref:DUF3649 domain-containing protein n=1 Tax=Lampropedia puyangensis TaxID=1330072 RepID=A0A4S8F765_9BURK|nr:DUF3649 domain-containing protein [Lampropedia puyangensis]
MAAVLRQGPLLSRIAAAAFGGYALGALFSVALVALPGETAGNVLWGMLGSFLVWSMAVLWVFAASSASKAWWGLGCAALALLPFAVVVWSA